MNALVSVSWLAEHLNDPGLVVVDATMPPVGVTPKVDTRARYLERHIPGAVFFDIDEISDHSTTLPHMLAPDSEFAHKMGALGIGDHSTIVVYEQEGVWSAPRARWTLRAYGANNVLLLDGGLKAWLASGQPVVSGEVTPTPAVFSAKLDHALVKDFAQMQQMIALGGAQILDARAQGRFSGAVPEPRSGLRSGHMPGATNTPFADLAQDGRMRSPQALRDYFQGKGVQLDQPITTTCGSGVTAAVVALGLELAGADKVTLYDGSWSEYGSRPEAVIVQDA